MRYGIVLLVGLVAGMLAQPVAAERAAKPAGKAASPAIAASAAAAPATVTAPHRGRRTAVAAPLAPPPPPDPGTQCRLAIAAAEQQHGIAPGLLGAIGRVESGRADPRGGGVTPWPWTINAEGQGRYFESRDEAIVAVQELHGRGVTVIDVGCMQVNLHHHPQAFATLEEAFDPTANARYAGLFLKRLATSAGGDWEKAAGHYHSGTPERADLYRAKVLATWAGLPLSPANLVLAAPGAPVPATPAQQVFRVNGTTVRALALTGRPDLTGERAAILANIAVPIRPTGQVVRGRPVFMVEVAEAPQRGAPVRR